MEDYEQQLKQINKDIDINVNNLKYLLNNINIEYINLYEFYLIINDLINRRRLIEQLIKDNKL